MSTALEIEQSLKEHALGVELLVEEGPSVATLGVRRDLELAVYNLKRAAEKLHGHRPIAPATYRGWQPGWVSIPGFELWNLTAPVGNHPLGSTVSAKTLLDAGFRLPSHVTEGRR